MTLSHAQMYARGSCYKLLLWYVIFKPKAWLKNWSKAQFIVWITDCICHRSRGFFNFLIFFMCHLGTELSQWQEQGNQNFDTACFSVKVTVNRVGLNTCNTNTKEACTAQRLKRGAKFVIGVQDSPVRRCGARHFHHDLSATFQGRNCSTERWTSARSARISKGKTFVFIIFIMKSV